MKFYLKLRRIIRDGETLQAACDGLSELVFQRRLKALEQRLDALLEWKNPNDTLKEVIKKVRRQKEHISIGNSILVSVKRCPCWNHAATANTWLRVRYESIGTFSSGSIPNSRASTNGLPNMRHRNSIG